MILTLIKSVSSLASGYMESKVQVQKVKAEIQKKQLTGEIDWDLEAVKSMQHSWRDEFFSILFSIPLILCFLGDWGRKLVADGFEALSTMPSWYSVTLGALVASSVGIRSITKFFGGKR